LRSAGRPKAEPDDPRLLIDVSFPPLAEEQEEAPEPPEESPSDLYPVATLRERRRAALIDAACLAFATEASSLSLAPSAGNSPSAN